MRESVHCQSCRKRAKTAHTRYDLIFEEVEPNMFYSVSKIQCAILGDVRKIEKGVSARVIRKLLHEREKIMAAIASNIHIQRNF